MKKLLYILLFFVPSILVAQQKTDQLLDQLVTKHGVVGVAGAYAIGDSIYWSNASGFACKKTEKAFTPYTLNRTASIAKCMTAVAIMQLVEAQKLSLDDKLSTYLPAFAKDKKANITIRHLLSHTSGISQYRDVKEVENQKHFKNLAEAIKVFQDRPLLFEPGSNFFYTSYGYVVLGRLIEVVSGQNYEEYMQENIWKASGMFNTGIVETEIDSPEAACLYHKKRKKAKLAVVNNLSNRTPGGGFYSTTADLIKFGQALLAGRLISKESLEKMGSSQFDQKEGNPYGLGFFLYGPPPHEYLVIGHSGEQTGCSAQLTMIPKSKTVVVVLSNTSGAWKSVVQTVSEIIQISETN